MTILERLLSNYDGFLLSVCKKYSKDPQVAEELQSIIALNFLEKNIYFTGNDNDFKKYIHTVVKNTFINFKNKASNKKNVYDNDILEYNGGFSNSTISNIMQKQLVDDVDKTISKILSERDQRIFKRYIRGFKYTEIAKTEKMNLQTVKTTIFQIKRKINEKINYKNYV